jgi:phospho-N-acetylmuramoyl-pentapeptide-transferase
VVELIQGLFLAFAVIVILMPAYIRLLRYVGIGKQIREEGPHSHFVKEGTPTMGGLLIVVVVALVALLLGALDASTYSPIATLIGVRLLGAFDDYLNAKTGAGINVRQKLLWQIVVAVLAAIYIQRHFAITDIRVPFLGDVVIGPILYIVFAAFAIVASSNGVNITDGLDGLADGTAIFAFVAYLIIACSASRPARLALLARSSSARRWASCGSTSTRPRSSWVTPDRSRWGRPSP